MWPAIIAGASSIFGGQLANTASARQAADSLQAQERAQQVSQNFSSASADKSNAFNRESQSISNAFSLHSQQVQNDFAERMATTGHQREVSDLRAAGLNPILSGTGGMGSPVPAASAFPGAGASAVGFSGSGLSGGAMASMRDAISPGVHSALEARRNAAEVENMRDQNDVIKEDKFRVRAQGWRELWQRNLLEKETDGQEIQNKILSHQEKGAKVEGNIDSGQYGAALRYLDRLKGSASSARQFMDAAGRRH